MQNDNDCVEWIILGDKKQVGEVAEAPRWLLSSGFKIWQCKDFKFLSSVIFTRGMDGSTSIDMLNFLKK